MQTPTSTAPRVVTDRPPNSRRNFFRTSGLGLASAGLILAGCKDDDDDDDMTGADAEVNLGTGDIGILNYAYALEQLEAAFYATVLTSGYYAGANADEKAVLADIEAHERAHADFFKTAIGSAAIPALTVDFSSVDFDSRDSVLKTAQTFEDLGVSAYNGAGKLLENLDFLLVAGKIVSVEARHASVIRTLSSNGSTTAFADDDVLDANGLDKARTPAEVLTMADAFITTTIDFSGLPQ